jgi:hypothetical protein
VALPVEDGEGVLVLPSGTASPHRGVVTAWLLAAVSVALVGVWAVSPSIERGVARVTNSGCARALLGHGRPPNACSASEKL